MHRLSLFQKRIILLFLDAQDKLLSLIYVSKEFYDLIYSGYAWDILFSKKHDKKWHPFKISRHLIRKFKHFKGVKEIHLERVQAFNSLSKIHRHMNEFSDLYIHQDSNRYTRFTQKNRDNFYYFMDCPQILKKLRNKPYGMSPLHIASLCNFADQLLSTMSSEEEKFKQCKECDPQKQIPLHYAIRSFKKDSKTIQALIKYGSDFDHLNKNQRTPLSIAAKQRKDDKDLILTLIKNGGMSDKLQRGTLLFHLCREKAPADIIQLCIDYSPHKISTEDAQALLTY